MPIILATLHKSIAKSIQYIGKEDIKEFLELVNYELPISRSKNGSSLLMGTWDNGIKEIQLGYWLVNENGCFVVYSDSEFNDEYHIIKQ